MLGLDPGMMVMKSTLSKSDPKASISDLEVRGSDPPKTEPVPITPTPCGSLYCACDVPLFMVQGGSTESFETQGTQGRQLGHSRWLPALSAGLASLATPRN